MKFFLIIASATLQACAAHPLGDVPTAHATAPPPTSGIVGCDVKKSTQNINVQIKILKKRKKQCVQKTQKLIIKSLEKCGSEYNTIQYYTIQHNTILYYTILYYTILYDTIRYDTIRYYTTLYYTTLHYITPHYTALASLVCYKPHNHLATHNTTLLFTIQMMFDFICCEDSPVHALSSSELSVPPHTVLIGTFCSNNYFIC